MTKQTTIVVIGSLRVNLYHSNGKFSRQVSDIIIIIIIIIIIFLENRTSHFMQNVSTGDSLQEKSNLFSGKKK